MTVSCDDPTAPAVTVRDNGVGIPAEKREAVFERFVRVDNNTLGPVPGTGLGLYISRELALRHGGSLELEEPGPGPGSTFTLRLPAAQEAAKPARPAETPAHNERPHLHVHRADAGGAEAEARAGRSR